LGGRIASASNTAEKPENFVVFSVTFRATSTEIIKKEMVLKMHRGDAEDAEMLDFRESTEQVIGAAIEVHKALGPGLLESAYEECLCRELAVRSIPFERQRPLPVEYKGIRLNCGYRLDLLVAKNVVVEIKPATSIEPVHEAQLLTYLKLGGWKIGLLINFNVPILKDGIRRRILSASSASPR
jgi:GxxExxY protein